MSTKGRERIIQYTNLPRVFSKGTAVNNALLFNSFCQSDHLSVADIVLDDKKRHSWMRVRPKL